MLEREPPTHTRLRGLVNRAFVSRSVERLAPRIAALSHKAHRRDPHFRRLRSPADLRGTDPGDGHRRDARSCRSPMHRDCSTGRTRWWPCTSSGEREPSRTTRWPPPRLFVGYMRSVVARRRGQPGDDILSLLLAAEQDGDRLSEDELITNAILLLNAGHEATVHAIGNSVASLLGGARPRQPWFATPERTAAAVEELLRIAPPLHMFTRYALQPLEIDGVAFRTGDKIGLLIGAANHDLAVYAAPEAVRSRSTGGAACGVRSRHPLLHRRAARAAGAAGCAPHPVRALAPSPPRRDATFR